MSTSGWAMRLRLLATALVVLGAPLLVPSLAVAAPTATIVGHGFHDANRSGAREPGEAGWSGVPVFIDRDGDGALGDDEPRTRTDAAGRFRLQTLEAGPTSVCVLSPPRLLRTSERCQAVTAVAGATSEAAGFGFDRPAETCPGGAIVDTIVGVRPVGDTRMLPPTALAGPANGPWAGTRLSIDARSGVPLVHARRGERLRHLIVIVPHAGMERPRVRVILTRGSERLVQVRGEDGTPAVNLGRGRRLPTPPPNTLAYFDQRGDLVVFGLPNGGDERGASALIVETEITTGSKPFRLAARLEGTVRVDGRARSLPTCRDLSLGRGF